MELLGTAILPNLHLTLQNYTWMHLPSALDAVKGATCMLLNTHEMTTRYSALITLQSQQEQVKERKKAAQGVHPELPVALRRRCLANNLSRQKLKIARRQHRKL